jgi:hypothetical protein
MKSILSIVAFLGATMFANAQTEHQQFATEYTIVPIIQAQELYLDSRMMSAVNGKSRLSLPIKLPQGTVRWFYSFAATESKSDAGQWIGLAGQLTRIVDKTGTIANIVDRIVQPTGSTICDVYVLEPETDIKAFENKEDDKWKALQDVSRLNMMGGVVDVTKIRHELFLGFNNPSLKSGISIRVEVSAVVMQQKAVYNMNATAKADPALWAADAKQRIFNDFEKAFHGKTGEDVRQVCVCMMNKTINSFVPADYQRQTVDELHVLYGRLKKDCLKETKQDYLATLDTKVTHLLRGGADSLLAQGKATEVANLSQEALNAGYQNTEISYYAAKSNICLQQYKNAQNSVDRILQSEPNNIDALLLQAHIFLLTNNIDKAEKIYEKYRGKKLSNGELWENRVGKDFNLLINNKVFSSFYNNVKKKLKIS